MSAFRLAHRAATIRSCSTKTLSKRSRRRQWTGPASGPRCAATTATPATIQGFTAALAAAGAVCLVVALVAAFVAVRREAIFGEPLPSQQPVEQGVVQSRQYEDDGGGRLDPRADPS